MSPTVQTTAPIVPSLDAQLEVARHHGKGEISDSAARTIASLWQSSGTVGSHLATLASGLPVDLDDLLDDIHHTRQGTADWFDLQGLDTLATWAIAKGVQSLDDRPDLAGNWFDHTEQGGE